MTAMKKCFPIVIACLLLTGVGCLIPAYLVADSDGTVDLDAQRCECEVNCNEMFGGIGTIAPGVTGADAIAWSNCRLKCERAYWKRYGQDTNE